MNRFFGWRTLAILIALLIVGVLANEYSKFLASTRSYAHVHLTDTRAEVKYRLGNPQGVLGKPTTVGGRKTQPAYSNNTMPINTTIDDYDDWVYDALPGGVIMVSFNHSDGTVQSISCVPLPLAEDARGMCPPLLGVEVGDTEVVVLAKLGAPDRSEYAESITFGTTKKTIRYNDVGADYVLINGKVKQMILRNEKGTLIEIGLRFLRTLLS